MQFKCYNCHATVSAPPHGGQVQCPNCRAVNVVPPPPTVSPTAASTQRRKSPLTLGLLVIAAVVMTCGVLNAVGQREHAGQEVVAEHEQQVTPAEPEIAQQQEQRKAEAATVEADPRHDGPSAQPDDRQANVAPPTHWHYRVSEDPMGGTIAIAQIESVNDFEFDFPYQGRQHATLLIRNDAGYDVMLAIERGQFVCTLGCSVQVRFDDGEAQRWRAAEPSDYDTTIVFLRNESKFLKQLRKAKMLRIAADFFQEGTRVLEFPVAGFEPGRLE